MLPRFSEFIVLICALLCVLKIVNCAPSPKGGRKSVGGSRQAARPAPAPSPVVHSTSDHHVTQSQKSIPQVMPPGPDNKKEYEKQFPTIQEAQRQAPANSKDNPKQQPCKRGLIGRRCAEKDKKHAGAQLYDPTTPNNLPLTLTESDHGKHRAFRGELRTKDGLTEQQRKQLGDGVAQQAYNELHVDGTPSKLGVKGHAPGDITMETKHKYFTNGDNLHKVHTSGALLPGQSQGPPATSSALQKAEQAAGVKPKMKGSNDGEAGLLNDSSDEDPGRGNRIYDSYNLKQKDIGKPLPQESCPRCSKLIKTKEGVDGQAGGGPITKQKKAMQQSADGTMPMDLDRRWIRLAQLPRRSITREHLLRRSIASALIAREARLASLYV